MSMLAARASPNRDIVITQLGRRGVIYHNEKELLRILLTIKREQKPLEAGAAAQAYTAFSPPDVMRTFREVFLT